MYQTWEIIPFNVFGPQSKDVVIISKIYYRIIKVQEYNNQDYNYDEEKRMYSKSKRSDVENL